MNQGRHPDVEKLSVEGKEQRSRPISRERALALYRTMLQIRRCEERLAKSHQRGLIHGACHTYVGEEAIAAGVCAHLGNKDPIFSTHRGHGHALAKGVSPQALIAELYGRETGISHGRGGSMHLYAPEIGLMGTSGIVGPCILQACGGGYTAKLKQNNSVSVAFFGDGAVNNGAFHEGLNMAAIWKLPVLFVCENNQFATEVSFEYACAGGSVVRRAQGYDIPAIEVDGNDVMAVHRHAGDAIERARNGEGPSLLECTTYRTRAHAEGMVDFGYRSQEEVNAWKGKNPIERFSAFLTEDMGIPGKDLDTIRQEIDTSIEKAHQFAEASNFPEPANATTHVYASSSSPIPNRPAIRTLNTPDDISTSETRELTFMQATLEALTEEMAVNPDIFVMGEGIGKRGGNFATTTGLYDRYGAVRLCDTPICERGFVGLSAGAAMTGTRPVIDFMFIDFILDSVGEILNQIAKMQYMTHGRLAMPVLLRGCIGVGHSAATHHSGSYHPMMAQVPGLRVVVPATPFDAKGLLKKALRSNDPVLFLEHREILAVKGPVPTDEYEIEFGKSVIALPGRDVTVVSIAHMLHQTLEAAGHLRQEDGVLVEVVDPRTVSPLDTDTILESVARTGRLLIVDETPAPCGIGAEIAARVVDAGFDELDAPIRRLNGAFTPTPYSPSLEKAVVPKKDDVIQAIRELMQE